MLDNTCFTFVEFFLFLLLRFNNQIVPQSVKIWNIHWGLFIAQFYDSIKVAGDVHGIEFIETFATSTYSTTKQNLTIN